MPPEPAKATIDYFSSSHPLRALATRVALRARRAMFRRFEVAVPFDQRTTVLDVGVTPDVELADSNYFERLYPYPANLTATSIEDASSLEEQYPGLTFLRTDGVTLPFPDGRFDVVFSSAVLEHVGNRESQRSFVAELCRVSSRFFVTTPNRWFPVEVHTFIPFIHWLPQRWHQALLRHLGLQFWADTNNLNLLGPKDLLALFPPGAAAQLIRHRTLGWTSNLVVHGTSRC